MNHLSLKPYGRPNIKAYSHSKSQRKQYNIITRNIVKRRSILGENSTLTGLTLPQIRSQLNPWLDTSLLKA